MSTFVFTIIIAVLYGVYDVFIKLSVGKVSPVFGALITQFFSVAAILSFIMYQFFSSKSLQFKLTPQGFIFDGIAGILIGLALIFLFILLEGKNTRITSILPTILVIRNVTLVSLGIIILGENFTLQKTTGLVMSLIGIYLMY